MERRFVLQNGPNHDFVVRPSCKSDWHSLYTLCSPFLTIKRTKRYADSLIFPDAQESQSCQPLGKWYYWFPSCWSSSVRSRSLSRWDNQTWQRENKTKEWKKEIAKDFKTFFKNLLGKEILMPTFSLMIGCRTHLLLQAFSCRYFNEMMEWKIWYSQHIV